MKALGIVVGVIVVIGLGVLAWAGIRPGPLDFADGDRVSLAEYTGKVSGVPADFTEADPLARGRYLAEAADCEACHTVEGGQPYAGGRPFDTEFGTIYSPNITPDPETGIGSYTDEDFLKAMHEGIGKGGKKLYPAFPYAAYTYLTEEDVAAIKAFIWSIPPVKYTAPEHTLKWPYNQRGLMTIWSALYNPQERFQPVASQTESWNRGAYMVEALGHCGDCHTPRTALQSLDNRRKFGGGMAEGWRAWNLSSDEESGIGKWSVEEIEGYLKTGRSENYGSAFGPMAEAVHLSFRKMTPSDLRAIAEYVKSVPAVSSPDMPAPKRQAASHNPIEGGEAASQNVAGEGLYASMCAGCHAWTGSNDYVPHSTLTGSRAVNDPTATNVALAVLRGAGDLPASDTAVATMPAFGHVFTDEDVAAVSNYVIARFGAAPSAITAADVARLREAR